MPMDSKGKYHMNPHHAKAADSAPPKQAPAPAADPGMDAAADPDAGSQMVTCPACGAQFPEEMGLAQPGMAAPEMHQPQSQPSGGSTPALTGY